MTDLETTELLCGSDEDTETMETVDTLRAGGRFDMILDIKKIHTGGSAMTGAENGRCAYE